MSPGPIHPAPAPWVPNEYNDYDLVVTDTTRPHLTGYKPAIEMMKLRPDIPVILCNGYSEKISDETAADIGIRAFACKPMEKADLARTIRKVLDESKNSNNSAITGG